MAWGREGAERAFAQMMESIACNLCGLSDHRVVYQKPDTKYFPEERFSAVECLNCGLGYVNPRPAFSEMSRYYPIDFYEYFDADPAAQMKRYRAEASYLKEFARSAEGRKRLLDIGCANGDFPRHMIREGWEVEGVEVSRNSKAIDDFPVYRAPFPDLQIDQPCYDAITAWAVLEHVHDPMSYFRKAARLLKKGGHFIFLVTNFKSISSRFLFLEDIPRHLYFFTEETVKAYLERNGFELLRADYNDKIYSMRPTNWLYYYFARMKGADLKFEDLPDTSYQSFSCHGQTDGFRLKSKYLISLLSSHPLAVIDKALIPIVERIQILSRRYGIMTFVARKP